MAKTVGNTTGQPNDITVATGAGAVDGDTQRLTLASDDPAVVRLTSPQYGSTTALLSSGLNSLATSTTVGYVSDEVDVSSLAARDVQIMVEAQMTTSGSPTGFIEVYALGSLDGTEYSGDTSYSGTAASYTLGAAGSVNLTQLGVIKPHANTNTYRGLFSLAAAFGGFVPPFWAIVVLNNSAIALHSSGSTVNYRVIT